MLLTLLIASVAVTGSFASYHSCWSDFHTYLNCIGDGLNHNSQSYGQFEREFYKDFRYLVTDECFANTESEANTDPERCFFPHDYLDVDAFGPYGPLEKCGFCLTVAKFLKNATMSADKETTKCVRRKIAVAVAAEAKPCLEGKLNTNNLPAINLPDFDVTAYMHKQDIYQSINLLVLAFSRLQNCGEHGYKNGNLDKYKNTKACLESPPVRGHLRSHCAAAGTCKRRSIDSDCTSEFSRVEPAACACIADTRVVIKKGVIKLAKDLSNLIRNNLGAGAKDSCVNIIKAALRTKNKDWGLVVDDIMKPPSQGGCLNLPLSSKKTGIDFLLDLACSRIVTRRGLALSQLRTALTFVGNLVDSMVERNIRFCDKPYCDKP